MKQLIRSDQFGGVLVLLAAAIALVWANSPWSDGYFSLAEVTVGPGLFGLDMSLASFASDGLLAVFFFVVGLELKREFTVGALRDPAHAAVPMVAAVCGMVVPAGIYLAVNAGFGGGQETARGWAIPVATDIAFALAILAIVGPRLAPAVRVFLLTLAVADDLLGITIIAVFYSEHIDLVFLALTALPLAAFAVLTRRGITSPWLLVPVGVVAWACMHESGVHATVAGVLLGALVPVAIGERCEHVMAPISAFLAVPIFAFFAAGVSVSPAVANQALSSSIAWGIVLGLVVGKPVGILAGTWLVTRFTPARLKPGLTWPDVVGVAMLGGIGFTVSLLIGELAFPDEGPWSAFVTLGVIVGSLTSAGLGSAWFALRTSTARPDAL